MDKDYQTAETALKSCAAQLREIVGDDGTISSAMLSIAMDRTISEMGVAPAAQLALSTGLHVVLDEVAKMPAGAPSLNPLEVAFSAACTALKSRNFDEGRIAADLLIFAINAHFRHRGAPLTMEKLRAAIQVLETSDMPLH